MIIKNCLNLIGEKIEKALTKHVMADNDEKAYHERPFKKANKAGRR